MYSIITFSRDKKISMVGFPVFFFKQFVVTNCSKERPGSIVNETLNNGILMQNLNENHTIVFGVSENPIAKFASSYLQKCGISYFLPKDKSRMRVYLFVFLFFFPRGHRINQVVLECCKRALSNGNKKF